MGARGTRILATPIELAGNKRGVWRAFRISALPVSGVTA